MSDKTRAEISIITTSLHDWFSGRISQRQWREVVTMYATAEQMRRIEAIPKFGYGNGIDALRVAGTAAYVGGHL